MRELRRAGRLHLIRPFTARIVFSNHMLRPKISPGYVNYTSGLSCAPVFQPSVSSGPISGQIAFTLDFSFFHRVYRIVIELHRLCPLGRIPSRLSTGDTSIRIIPLGASSHHGGTTQRHLTSLSSFWRILPLSPGERRQLVRSSHERAPG